MTDAPISSGHPHAMRNAGLAALVGAAAWLAKFIVIWAGNSSENLHGILHVLGTLAFLVAIGLSAWAATASRGTGLRILAVVGACLVFFVAVGAVEEGLNAAIDPDDESVLEELVLLVIGVPALVIGLAVISRTRRASPEKTIAT